MDWDTELIKTDKLSVKAKYVKQYTMGVAFVNDTHVDEALYNIIGFYDSNENNYI